MAHYYTPHITKFQQLKTEKDTPLLLSIVKTEKSMSHYFIFHKINSKNENHWE